MKNSRRKIVIYGGSFNPPHIAHAIAIEIAMRLFDCDEIWVMPSADRRDKKIGVSGPDRLKMLAIMISELFPESKTPIKISSLEIDRPKLTTTYETKLELEAQYPGANFYFLVGSDILGDIEKKWVNGDKLFKTANFIAIKKLYAPLPKNLPPNLTVLDNEISENNISSTFVRKLLTEGHTGIPYITKKVAEFIKKNRLYDAPS